MSASHLGTASDTTRLVPKFVQTLFPLLHRRQRIPWQLESSQRTRTPNTWWSDMVSRPAIKLSDSNPVQVCADIRTFRQLVRTLGRWWESQVSHEAFLRCQRNWKKFWGFAAAAIRLQRRWIYGFHGSVFWKSGAAPWLGMFSKPVKMTDLHQGCITADRFCENGLHFQDPEIGDGSEQQGASLAKSRGVFFSSKNTYRSVFWVMFLRPCRDGRGKT